MADSRTKEKKKKKNPKQSFRKLMRELKKPLSTKAERQDARKKFMDQSLPKVLFQKVDKI